MAIVKRLVKGSALTYAELDGNFDHLTAEIASASSGVLSDLSSSNGSSLVGFVQNGSGANATTVQSKLREIITPKDFGAVGDGVVDDTAAIQESINFAETVGGIVDGGNKFYAISSQLTIGGSLAIVFQNINLIAISGTWPTGSTGAMLAIREPTNFESNYHTFQNITCNCNDQAKTGFYVYRVQAKTAFIDCHTWYFSEYGFWIKGTGDGNNDTKYIGCTASERIWIEEGSLDAFRVYADRTAYAWYVDYSADIEFIDCVGYGSLRALVIDGGPFNNQFIGCKFWNGPARTEATSVTVEIIDGERNQFIGCRFDDGAVRLKTFNNQFNGCLFIQYNAGNQLELEATSADETAAGFMLQGCRFTGNSPFALTTSGSGSWATSLAACVVGNCKIDGTPVTVNTWEFQSGAVKYKNGQYTFGDGLSVELFTLDGAAGSSRYYEVKSGGLHRWAWGAAEDDETGSNAGSTWGLLSYADDGSYLLAPITVERATGKVVMANSLTTKPGSTAPTLVANGQVTFELTNNTTLTFKARGSDGTTRSGTVTLA